MIAQTEHLYQIGSWFQEFLTQEEATSILELHQDQD